MRSDLRLALFLALGLFAVGMVLGAAGLAPTPVAEAWRFLGYPSLPLSVGPFAAVSENMGKIAHPEVHVFIPVLVPYFGTLGLFDVQRVGRKKMNIMRNASWHHLFRPFEEVFREACLSPVDIREMFHGSGSFDFCF